MTPQPEFVQATEKIRFAKLPIANLRATCADELQSVRERVWAWVILHSWGNQHLHCVRHDGSPAWQRDCVADLNLNKAAVSKAIAWRVARGYMRDDPKLLIPVFAPALNPVPENNGSPEGFEAFFESWKVSNQETFERLEKCRGLEAILREQLKDVARETSEIMEVARNDYQEFLAAQPIPAAIEEEKKADKDVRTNGSPEPTAVGAETETEPAALVHAVPPETPAPGRSEMAREAEAIVMNCRYRPKLPDDRLLAGIEARLKDPAALPYFETRVLELKQTVRSMGLFLHLADEAAQDLARDRAQPSDPVPRPAIRDAHYDPCEFCGAVYGHYPECELIAGEIERMMAKASGAA